LVSFFGGKKNIEKSTLAYFWKSENGSLSDKGTEGEVSRDVVLVLKV